MINPIEFERLSGQNKENFARSYLKFQLTSELRAALPMSSIEEVINLPSDRLSPIPFMPDYFLGLINIRSRIFWAVDLAMVLELPPVSPNLVGCYQSIIIKFENTPLALIVREIEGAMEININSFQSPKGYVASELLPYIKSCVWQNEILPILNIEAIINFCSSNKQF